MSSEPPIDKDMLYGDYRKAVEDRHNLAMKAAHKALDLAPDDDMKIEANRTTNGVGGKAVVGAALAAGLPAAALAGLLLTRQPAPAPPEPAASTIARPAVPVPRAQDWDAVYEVQLPDGTWKETKRERLKTK